MGFCQFSIGIKCACTHSNYFINNRIFLLIKGADFLAEGASAIAKNLKISEIVIGLTIVAFGTSTSELVVNITSSLKGSTDLSSGNIIGSNITNIALIFGVSGIIYPIQTEKNTVWREIPFSLLAVIALMILCNDFKPVTKFSLSRRWSNPFIFHNVYRKKKRH